MNIKELHESDFNLWVEEMKIKIKNRDVETMDWDNLLDEIDDMGKSEKRSLDSYMQKLIEHILKLRYWGEEKERCQKGWIREVVNFRTRINRILKKNPSLKNYLTQEYPDIFQDAVKVVRCDFDLPEDNFIPLQQMMSEDYLGK